WMRETAGMHGCDRTVDAQAIADYAERYLVYIGPHGVCAGPQALIDEYLRLLIDGAPAPIEAEPSVLARLGDLDAALDYGLHGQRIESLVRMCGAAQGLEHQRLRAALADAAPGMKLREVLERPVDTAHYSLLRDDHPLLETFELELQVSRWLYMRA